MSNLFHFFASLFVATAQQAAEEELHESEELYRFDSFYL